MLIENGFVLIMDEKRRTIYEREKLR